MSLTVLRRKNSFFRTLFSYNLRLALTKLDILNDFAEIKIAIAYKIDDRILSAPPGLYRILSIITFILFLLYLVQIENWDRIEVVYETFDGWQMDISNIRQYDQLPINCRKMIEFIENFVQVRGCVFC